MRRGEEGDFVVGGGGGEWVGDVLAYLMGIEVENL